MKYVKINQSKLKIILSEEDLADYSLEGALSLPDTPKHRRSYRALLDGAARECGFSAKGDRILIQIYPTDEGGEMLVSKLTRLTQASERSLAASPSVALMGMGQRIFMFDSIGALLSVLRRLELGGSPRGEVFFSDGGEYYLVIEEDILDSSPLPLAEYGTPLSPAAYPYVREHMKRIGGEGVIRSLSEL